MNNQLLQLIIIQFKEFLRAPGIIFWGILFPVLMAWGLGIAFTKKPSTIRNLAIVGELKEDGHVEKFTEKNDVRKLQNEQSGFEYTIKNDKLGNTTFRFISTNWDSAVVMLKRGSITMILKEVNDSVQYHFDPFNPEGQLIHTQLTRLFSEKEPLENTGSIKPMTLKGTRYIDFLIPGLIAMGVMMSCMWGISYSMVEKRSKKLLRRMVATPMKRSNFLLSMFVARLGLNITESTILYIFAYFYFGSIIQGSLPALLLIYIAGNFVFSGIAILVSSRTSKTEIGNGLINVVVTPMMILSGIFFSYHNFPDWAKPFIEKLPLTMLADGIRGVFNEGLGFEAVAGDVFILFATGFISFVVGLKIYKWY